MSDEKDPVELFVAYVEALSAEAKKELEELARRDRKFGEDVAQEHRS